MANIFKFKALENIECRFFDSIDSSIVNIETIKPDIDDDFENDHSELGCQLEDKRWIVIAWDHGEDRSIAYPAYYSILWNSPVPIHASHIDYELKRIASGNVDSIKKQVEQWLPHLTDEELRDDVSRAIHREASNG